MVEQIKSCKIEELSGEYLELLYEKRFKSFPFIDIQLSDLISMYGTVLVDDTIYYHLNDRYSVETMEKICRNPFMHYKDYMPDAIIKEEKLIKNRYGYQES